MAEKDSAAGAPPQSPLTEADLAELEQLGRGGEATALEWRAAALAAHPFLLAEVRRLRARVKELEERFDQLLEDAH